MKRVKEKQAGVRQSLLLASLAMASVGAHASVEFTTYESRFIQPAYPPPVFLDEINVYGFYPTPTVSLNSASASSSVSGSMNYSVGTSSGSFSESDSSPDGSVLELELKRKGYGYRAEASTETGLARARVETQWVAGSGNGSSAAGASSTWSDWFVISGGTGLDTASFASLLDGVLSSGKNGSASFNLNIGYTPNTNCYTLCGEADSSQTLVNQSFSLSGKGKSTLGQEIEGEFAFAYDKPFALTVMLGVDAANGGMADFTLWSLGNSLVLPEGANVLSASGLPYVQAVPEAETYAMMLAGLGLVGWAARRRRARH